MKSKVRINILNEKRIRGFSGSNYDDEAIDALKEFAEAGKVLSQQIKEKTFSEDDPLVQEIFSLLDEDTQGELRELTQQLMDLVSELPDKPEKQKIGFRETLEEKEKPGLWANIRAKRKRVGKAGMAKKGSKAYKSAKKAGDEINKEKNEELKNPKKADLDKDGKLSSYEKARGKGIEKAMGLEENMSIQEVLDMNLIDENITEAKYKGKTVQLNKPMRGDSKKFKVYVNSGKKNADGSIKVKKVNFGHGGTSAKRPTMRIRKSDPKRRKAFRARHRCDNPGPKTMARYWSCRKW